MVSWRESNPVPHFGGPIRCFFLCLLCLASARLHQTKQKSLEYCSSKCACSFYGADFRPSKTSAAGNTDVFPRLITQRGRKSARKNRHGFNSRQLIVSRHKIPLRWAPLRYMETGVLRPIGTPVPEHLNRIMCKSILCSPQIPIWL